VVLVKDLKKAKLAILLSTILILSIISMHVFFAGAETEAHGPAPNSGDCIPDGSGYDPSDWPNNDKPGMGPAPNSGDGVPDGSGF
jgi:hypothetical protein